MGSQASRGQHEEDAGERHVRVHSGKHERHGGENDDRGFDEHALQGDDVGIDAERVSRRENGQVGSEQVNAKQADCQQSKASSGNVRQGENEQDDGRYEEPGNLPTGAQGRSGRRQVLEAGAPDIGRGRQPHEGGEGVQPSPALPGEDGLGKGVIVGSARVGVHEAASWMG